MRAYQSLLDKDVNPFEVHAVVDAGSSEKFSCMMVDKFPCITATRGKSLMYWLSSKMRMVELEELCRLQGFQLETLRHEEAEVRATSVGHMVGNTMSVNILERLLPRLLFSAGLISHLPPDRWKSFALHGGPFPA